MVVFCAPNITMNTSGADDGDDVIQRWRPHGGSERIFSVQHLPDGVQAVEEDSAADTRVRKMTPSCFCPVKPGAASITSHTGRCKTRARP